jgi:hypothetical protein
LFHDACQGCSTEIILEYFKIKSIYKADNNIRNSYRTGEKPPLVAIICVFLLNFIYKGKLFISVSTVGSGLISVISTWVLVEGLLRGDAVSFSGWFPFIFFFILEG